MKPNNKFWFLGFSLLFFSFLIQAQDKGNCSFTLKGYVLDEHDRSPLEYALIYVEELKTGAVADSLGYYEIKNLCKGDYNIMISHIGCASKKEVLKVTNSIQFNFYLEHHAELLKTIIVKDSRIQSTASQTNESLSGKKLERLAGRSLGESLKSITGVQTIQTGPAISKPVIHGLYGNRILILNNGVRQEGQQWGTDHAPEIDPFIADKLTVLKGSAAVQYGSDAVAGVVIVEPAPLPIAPVLSGKLHLAGISNGRQGVASAMLQGGIKALEGFGWRLHGTVKKSGDAHAPDYSLTNTAMQEYSFSASAGWQNEKSAAKVFYSQFNTELGILRSSHIGNLTDLEAALTSEEPLIIEDFSYQINNPKQRVRHDLMKVEGGLELSGGGKLSAIYGLQFNDRKEFDVRRGGRSEIPSLDLDLLTQTLDVKFDHAILKNHLKGNFGISGFYQQNKNVPGTGVRPLIPNYSAYSLGLFWTERWISDHWEAEAGFRYDRKFVRAKKIDLDNQLLVRERHFNGFSATVGGVWKLNPLLKMRSNIGTAIRPPNVSELFSEGLHHAVASIEEGDENLQQEKALKWVTSLEFQKGNVASFDVSFYTHFINDYIYLQPQAERRLTIRGAFPVFKYLQTDARLIGLDFSGKVQIWEGLSGILKGNGVRAKNTETQEDLLFIPADRIETGLFYEWSSLGKFQDAHIEISYEWVARQSRVPEGIDFSPSPEGYNLLHAFGEATIILNKTELSIHAGVRNLLNVSYRDYLNRLRYYADDTGRSFEVRLKYVF
ncbi:MAG: TonB-dependent receptor [Bacteroidetes bacterium]|nr:TonB-dependent receptor [Bacteroidota bacterium]